MSRATLTADNAYKQATAAADIAALQAATSNIDNTADADKPVSTAQQTALDGKVDDAQVLTDVPAGAVFTDTTYAVGDGGDG